VRNLAVSVYDLIPGNDEQLTLFASPQHAVSEAMDKINDRWGEFVVTPALMMGMEDIRVNLGLWYSEPPMKGGHSYGSFTLRRSTDAPDRGARFDQSHRE
jgi:hypothetical protein